MLAHWLFGRKRKATWNLFYTVHSRAAVPSFHLARLYKTFKHRMKGHCCSPFIHSPVMLKVPASVTEDSSRKQLRESASLILVFWVYFIYCFILYKMGPAVFPKVCLKSTKICIVDGAHNCSTRCLHWTLKADVGTHFGYKTKDGSEDCDNRQEVCVSQYIVSLPLYRDAYCIARFLPIHNPSIEDAAFVI